MNKILTTLIAAAMLTVTFAQAKEKPAPVEVTTASYQVKIVKDKHGKKVRKWVRATKVVPGTIVRYIDTVTNHTDQAMNNVAVKNPINPHLTYLAKSAKCETGCTVRYSVDGGKHFDVPAKLFVTDKKGKKHLAQPKHYNAVEWIIVTVPAGKSVQVEFKAKLK